MIAKRATTEQRPRGRWIREGPAGLHVPLLALCLALIVGACSGEALRAPVRSCSEQRLELSANLLDDAKAQAISHYASRAEEPLVRAYYSSRDAIVVARSIRQCWDFDSLYRQQAVDLIRSSVLLQRIVKQTMRDPDSSVAQTLFRERYYEVFENDINSIRIQN